MPKKKKKKNRRKKKHPDHQQHPQHPHHPQQPGSGEVDLSFNAFASAETSSLNTELKALQLQIMSKKSWKRLRNLYLDTQRKNMSEAKKSLRQWKANEMEKEAANEVFTT